MSGHAVALDELVDHGTQVAIRFGRLSHRRRVQDPVHLPGAGDRTRVGRVLGVAPLQVHIAAVYRQGGKGEQADEAHGQQDGCLPRFALSSSSDTPQSIAVDLVDVHDHLLGLGRDRHLAVRQEDVHKGGDHGVRIGDGHGDMFAGLQGRWVARWIGNRDG